MPEFKPRPYRSDLELEQNALSVKQHIEDKDFKLWFPARVFNVSTASGAEGVYAGSPYWDLPDAATSTVVTDHYVPSYWINGKVAYTVYYTGNPGSTANFNVSMRITGYLVNGTALTVNTGDVTAVETGTIPGPAVADELLTYTTAEANWLALTIAYPFRGIRFTRNGTAGSDANTGDLRLLGVLLQFYPTRR